MQPRPRSNLRVAIAGGGLAGLTCAKVLADAGLQVTVLESLPYLGGRAGTYRDADGDWVEQGLHAALKAEPFFAAIADLPTAPAISLQVWFDREVTRRDGYTMVPHSRNPVYQDQARRTYPYGQGSRLSVIVSPADGMLDWTDDAITDHVLASLGAANPEVAAAKVVKRVVLKHPRHLLRPLPGAMSARPRQATPVANLFLAGDWTQQDFFGSQEGAVRGGNACARAILSAREQGRL